MRSYKLELLPGMPSFVTLFAVLLFSTMSAQFSLAQAPVKNRISQPINASQMSVLRGNVHPMARAQYDQGPVAPSLQLERITIVFQRTPAQQADLDQLLEQQQNPSSPDYHKWLTPSEFADRFGITPADLAKVAAWLTSQGFTVVETPSSRSYIAFNGTAAQVQSAFHVPIHRYVANGKSFFANSTEPSVPSALAGMVLGFRGLNNFPVKPRGIMRRIIGTASQPNFTSSISGNNFLAPGDFATIYDLNSLYGGSPAIDGTGQKIAVMGQSNIVASDVATFRSLSGLPANAPQLQLVQGSTDPGIVDGDVQEASLDVEWSGAVAKNATIIYVFSKNGVFDSFAFAIANNLAPVISISYGACENLWTSSEIAVLVAMAQQANSQGMTILAASGDGGAADCDGDSGAFPAVQGLTVDVPASLPFVTGIGGTEFNEGNGTYWKPKGSTDIVTSALSYIPEVAWNDTNTPGALNTLSAGGGGVSKLFAKPIWQTGTGVPNDNARDVPDISVNASPSHDGYLICTQIKPSGSQNFTASCVNNSFRFTDGSLTVFGGTSFGAPTFAGIVALINQKTNSTGQGNVNYILYPLAASTPSAFHDVIGGANGFSGNEVPCSEGTPDCPSGGNIGFAAVTGYDLATGLGSFDGFNMVNAWSSVTPPTGSTPTLNSISPTTATAGSGDFTLTANGINFASNAQILWNGSAAGVTMQTGGTSTMINATISHTLITFGSLAAITVSNQSPTSGGSAARTLTVTAAPPPNDNFANAIAVTSVPFSSTVDNSGATTEPTDPVLPASCAGNSTNTRTKTVWWSYTAGTAGSVNADTIGSAYDTTLSVWTGTPGNLTNVACNDDIVSGQDTQSSLTFTAAAGTTYYFMVAPFGPPDSLEDQFGGKTVLNVTVSSGSVSALSAAPGAQTVTAGASATFQIMNTSTNTFSLTCFGLPTGATCAAASVGSKSTAPLVISTTSRSSFTSGTSLPVHPGSGRLRQFFMIMATALGLCALFARRRRVRALVPAGMLVAVLVLFAGGCGGAASGTSSNPNGTPAGTFTIVITGTSGSTTQKTSVVLQVN
jgi:subtilase family serine protease